MKTICNRKITAVVYYLPVPYISERVYIKDTFYYINQHKELIFNSTRRHVPDYYINPILSFKNYSL